MGHMFVLLAWNTRNIGGLFFFFFFFFFLFNNYYSIFCGSLKD
jgi:hypothetical protein